MKRQTTDWGKIFPNKISNKGVSLRIYKDVSTFNTKEKKNNQSKSGQKIEKILHQRRNADEKIADENMFNATSY